MLLEPPSGRPVDRQLESPWCGRRHDESEYGNLRGPRCGDCGDKQHPFYGCCFTALNVSVTKGLERKLEIPPLRESSPVGSHRCRRRLSLFSHRVTRIWTRRAGCPQDPRERLDEFEADPWRWMYHFSPSDLITDELRQDRFPMAVRASVDGARKYLETQRLCGNASSASDPRAERCTLPQSSRQAGG